eukprot:CAMPEP_0197031744 /NCGR_PEP_ID=MMETSP1384-20130603/10649_1 /TAXON_ID=29189 /ORGANISM="Ammonia sp." /LENGTH=748 /DNA_ID=CAMNT_0042461315 /DNA_START=52 /DNA_END=2298 /DNA_ORIENTATION=+
MNKQQLPGAFSPYNAPSSRTPSGGMHRAKSDPTFATPKQADFSLAAEHHAPHIQRLNINEETYPLKKRVMTLPTNLAQYHHPAIVLELLLNLPMEAKMGVGDNLKPLIDKAIAEQTKLEQLYEKLERDEQDRARDRLYVDEQKQDDNAPLLPAAPLAIPPTAPLAIPPTAPAAASAYHHQQQQQHYQAQDSLDELAFYEEFHDDLNAIKPAQHMQRPHSMHTMIRGPSIKQFQSVLQERYTKSLVIAVTQALFGAFLSGYNTSVLNTPSEIVQRECVLTLDQYASLQSFFCLGGLIGALSIGKVADAFGRKMAILMYDLVFIVSGVLLAVYWQFIDKQTPNSWVLFAISRALAGIGAGIATAIIPTYLGEISPPLIRGAIGTCNQLTVCIGLVVAELFGGIPIFKNASLWPYLFALNIILPLIQMCTFWTFPESPKWLITKQDEDEARKVLQRLRECDDVELDLHFTKLANKFQQRKRTLSHQSLLDVHTIAEQEKQKHKGYGAVSDVNESTAIEVIDNVQSVQQSPLSKQHEEESKQLRRVLAWSISIAIGLQFLQQFSGINSVFYYSNPTLMNAGFTSAFDLWIGNVAIAFANFLSVFIPVFLMDKWGRKTLLNISLIGMIIASILFSCSLIVGDELEKNAVIGYVSVLCLIFYVVSFEIGLGPIPWLMMAEITPSSHRAMIVSVATFFNWVSNLCIAQFANTIVTYAKFFPFAAVCAVGLVLTKKFVPETKGKTEMEIQAELLKQ